MTEILKSVSEVTLMPGERTVVPHNLGTRDIYISVYSAEDGIELPCLIMRPSETVVTIAPVCYYMSTFGWQEASIIDEPTPVRVVIIG